MTKAGSKRKGSGSEQAGAGEKLLKSGAPVSVGKATQFKKGQSGNPAGRPEGRLNLSTHIQNLLNAEDFETWLPDPQQGWKEFKGVPMKAIISTAITRAIAGDMKAMDWIAKYGYGTRIDLDVTSDDKPIPLLMGLAPSRLIVEDTDDGGPATADDSADKDQQA